MKTTRVTVHFTNGLHLRPAAKLARLLKGFRSDVVLRLGNRVASSASITSILLLSATCNAQLEVQAAGSDEDRAIRAAEVFFQSASEDAIDGIGGQFFPDGGGETIDNNR
jgi:phosphotransferase system HPr (HPr) family protein